MFDLPDTAILFADSARGIFIPQHFAEAVKRECVDNVFDGDWAVLEAGPDHEHYWETWAEVEQSAIVVDPSNGIRYRLYQDGDLYLIPEDWQPDED